ncbi:MAG: ABC transporter ATP-binding protein [Carnobacterium sp.]|uniref:ABC transporter ATP-binding protein n=1 Tax=Carnobacterium sp. TaxID=48221 RepID=UPI003314F025
MLKIDNLNVNYGKKEILDSINLEFYPSEIIGLVAPNGAGKTTLLRTVSGLIKPKSGQILIDNLSRSEDRKAYYKKIYFVESNQTLYPNLSGMDHLKYVKASWDSPVEIENVIKRLGIIEYVNRPIKKLSLGMKQHILMAMCIVSNADVILLDEPMNGLDPTSIKKISSYLKKMKQDEKTILFSSHILSNIDAITDKIIFLKDKQVAYFLDKNKENLSSEDMYEQLYNMEVEI